MIVGEPCDQLRLIEQLYAPVHKRLLVQESPLLGTRIGMTTIAKSIHAPLVVAAGYFAHPARAVSSDLRDLLGPRPLAQQPHDLKVRAFYGVLRFPVEVLQLFCSRMRRQLYPLWHTCILQPDSVLEADEAAQKGPFRCAKPAIS